ncbi:cation:proton antiporter [Natronobacterium texcoconense]|nr:cation:proton antiporter [Natronobacterium texcoconense]
MFDSLSGFPLEDPIYVFTLALAAFLVGPLLIKRLGQPGIVGIVLLGVLIGPDGTGLVAHGDAIELLGTVGLVYLLFTVGLELNLRGFFRAPENAAVFGLTSFFLPLTVGVFVCTSVLGFDFWPALLLSAVFASHTLLAYPIVNRYDVTQNDAVTAVFGGILFTDTLALTLLAIVLGVADGGGLSPLLIGQVFSSLILLFATVWLVVPPIARWFFYNLSDESYFEFLFVLVFVFASASLAEILGIDGILGAFVAGVAFNRLIPQGSTLMNRIEFVGNAFFIPFFLLHVGMLVNVGVILDGPQTLQIATVIIATMIGTKFVAAWTVGELLDFDRTERGVMFGLSSGQAAAALAITILGVEAGLFGAAELNAVVLMLLVTALVSPWITERYSRRLAVSDDADPEREDAVDPRILLPLPPDSENRRDLLEFGFLLRDESGTNPIHLLSVVRPSWSGDTESNVEEVESQLRDLAEFAYAAEAPLEIETRVNHNVASGIARGALETRSDHVIMGWNPSKTFGEKVFGSIIDQVLDWTTLPVSVTHFGHPVNTTGHLRVIVPRSIDHHDGFYEGVYKVKRLADKLGVPITVYVFEEQTNRYQQLFDFVEIDVSAEFETVSGWDDLQSELRDVTESNDLVVTLSSRVGGVGWDDELEALPNRLVELPSRSFVVFYLREGEPDYDSQFLRID